MKLNDAPLTVACAASTTKCPAALCRRKNREQKAFSKQTQIQKEKERILEKKAQIASITKLRKQRVATGFKGDLDLDGGLNVRKPAARSPIDKAGQRIRPGAPPP